MATISLNTSTFVAVTTADKCLIQIKGGMIQLADSATPTGTDWTEHQPGDMLVIQAVKYARAVGAGVSVQRNLI